MEAQVDLRASRPTKLRLGFVSARSAFQDASGVWTDAGLARLIDALGMRCSRLTVALSVAPTREPLWDHRLAGPAEDFASLPSMPSLVRGLSKGAACRRVIREVERRSDVVVVQLPFAAPTALVSPRKPRLYHVCADVREIVRTSRRFGGQRRLAALVAAEMIDRFYRRLLHQPHARVVTNGDDLLAHFDVGTQGSALVSSSIFDHEIQSIPRTRAAEAPFRVLFVGYLRPEKGIDTLLVSFERLLADLPHAELHIVSARDAAEHGTTDEVRRALARLEQRGAVRFLGHRNFGPELFQCFADADVLAVPSRSEGTPRVLVEARAFGCPVVGTRVGGIPTSIADGADGLLVPPDDPPALADALLRIGTDGELKARLVQGGLARARQTTVDVFAQRIIEETQRLGAPST
jgi:glycosyltransferase involved in cell wall biosynthesis